MSPRGPVLAIIPARGGSKGLPRKNVRPLGGEPLIGWTIRAALAARHVDAVVVTSDDEEILTVAASYPGCGVIRRPAELATDTATSLDVVLHAAEQRPGYPWGVLLQPTSPLRGAADIDAALDLMAARSADSCVAAVRASEPPEWMFRLDADDRVAPMRTDADAGARRQDTSPCYLPNGAIYAFSFEWLRSQRRFVSSDTVAYVMPRERSVDIDDALDFRLAEALLAERQRE